jgi:hypothetical protein
VGGCTCNGAKHVYVDGVWVACVCLRQQQDRLRFIDAGIATRSRKASSFGRRFPQFARDALAFPGPSLLSGSLPTLEEATFAIVSMAIERFSDSTRCQAVTVDSLVDAMFDRKEKREMLARFKHIGFLAIVCGVETPHSWNGKTVTRMVLSRRYERKPTLIACTASKPCHLYGAESKAMFDGLSAYPRYELES